MTEKDNIVNESYVESFFGGVGETQVAAPVTKTDEEEDTDKDKKSESNFSFKTDETEVPINKLIDVEKEELAIEEDEDIIIPSAKETKPKSVSTDSNLNSAVSELIKEGLIFGFDGEEEIKSIEDLKELIQANKEEWKKEALENELDEVFSALPEDLQYAVDYVKNGGRDLKSLFKVLAQTQDIKGFDVGTDQKEITRTYLEYTKFGTPEEIEEQLSEWEDMDLLDKKAEQFKPKLEKLQEKVVQEKLAEQEEVKKYQKQLIKNYFDGVTEALQDKNLNGITINKDEQASIYEDLTANNYVSSRTGQPINYLGKFLEHITWDEPNYKMLAELTLFAKNPEKYREKIKASVKASEAENTVRKLKTAQGGLKPSTTPVEEEPNKFTIPKKSITRNSILRK
jgi:hypothetical protein